MPVSPWELHKLASKIAVILEELGKCFLIAFLNNASPDKLINQIFLYFKCSYYEPNLSSLNKKRRQCGTRGFTTAKALSQICFGFLFFILQQRGPGTKLLISEWTAVMSPDATGDFLILAQYNLMFDLRWKRPEPTVTIWWKIQLALSPFLFFFYRSSFIHSRFSEMHRQMRSCQLQAFVERILAGRWYIPTTVSISFHPDGHSMQDQQIIHQTGNGSFIENEVNRWFEPGLWLAMLACSRY